MSRQPSAGETVDMYITMSSVPTTEPTPESPLPVPVILASVLGAILILAGRRN